MLLSDFIQNQNGIKGIILKRYSNLFLWALAMVILSISVLATLYVAFGLQHPLFSFFFFVPLFAMFVHGLSKRVILTEPLYGTKASEIWVEGERITPYIKNNVHLIESKKTSNYKGLRRIVHIL